GKQPPVVESNEVPIHIENYFIYKKSQAVHRKMNYLTIFTFAGVLPQPHFLNYPITFYTGYEYYLIYRSVPETHIIPWIVPRIAFHMFQQNALSLHEKEHHRPSFYLLLNAPSQV